MLDLKRMGCLDIEHKWDLAVPATGSKPQQSAPESVIISYTNRFHFRIIFSAKENLRALDVRSRNQCDSNRCPREVLFRCCHYPETPAQRCCSRQRKKLRFPIDRQLSLCFSSYHRSCQYISG